MGALAIFKCASESLIDPSNNPMHRSPIDLVPEDLWCVCIRRTQGVLHCMRTI
jgi:hypothetical protein